MSEKEKKKTTRTMQREQALCLLYACSFNKGPEREEIDEFYENALTLYGYEDSAYLRTVFYGVINNTDALDGIIAKYAIGWKLERIARISLTLMRICLFEAGNLEDVPSSVAINEAIELAKKYDTDEAPAFINGILNNAVKGEGLDK